MLLNSARSHTNGQFGQLRRLWMDSANSNDDFGNLSSSTPEGFVTKSCPRTKMTVSNVPFKCNNSARSELLEEVATTMVKDSENAPLDSVHRSFQSFTWSAPNPVRRRPIEPSLNTSSFLSADVPYGYRLNSSRDTFDIYDPSILRHFLASRLEYTVGTVLDGRLVPVFGTLQIACPPPPAMDTGEVTVAEHADDTMVLGQGAFGAVVKGKILLDSRTPNKIVAVKFFKASGDMDFDKLYEDISRECRFHMVAGHLGVSPCCFGILPGIEEPGYARVAMVTEYFDGDNLWESFIAKRVVYSEKQVFAMVLKLSSAIRILHSYDICHNDINKNNVMIKKKQNGDVDLKLVDFGVSTVPGESMAYDVMTPGFFQKRWLAPELRVGGCTSKASDIWSAGYCVELIASVTKIKELEDIYGFCYIGDPRNRPTAEEFEEFCALFVEDT